MRFLYFFVFFGFILNAQTSVDPLLDKNFKIKQVWIDGILAEPWFITDCVYYPEYFRKLHNYPTEIKSPFIISFPGTIKFTFLFRHNALN